MRSDKLSLLAAAALALVGCAYEAPLNPNAEPVLNVIAGTVVVDGAAPDELGAVFVALYDADDPPPPLGTGAPVTFGAVPPEAFTGDSAGIQSAPYSVTEVPDGDYLVSALVDRDGDFHPLVSALAGGTCGDLSGGHLADISSAQPAVVSVAGGQLLDDVTLAVANEYLYERPVVYVPTGTTLSRQAAVDDPDEPQLFEVYATGVHSPILEIADPGEPCGAAIPYLVVDADLDGLADPYPNAPDIAGLYDIWPRVYLVYQGAPDADGNIVSELEAGEQWVGQGIVNPYYYTLGAAPLNETVLFPEAQIVWLPGGLHVLPDGSEEITLNPLELPPGIYGLTLVAATGQTWSVPNELASTLYPSTDASYDPATQATYVILE